MRSMTIPRPLRPARVSAAWPVSGPVLRTPRRRHALQSVLAALAWGALGPAGMAAQPAAAPGSLPAPPAVAVPGSALAVVVRVPKPWYAPSALVVSRMRDAVPDYEAIPGLAFKAFSLAKPDGQFGGLYLWNDAARARAFFGPEWFERVRRERGVEPQVTFYEVPVAIDNTPGGTPRDLASSAVGTVVTIPVPPGLGRERLVQGFQASIPDYRQAPGLLRKHYILTGDGRFGGIYLWADEASARRWFSDDWHRRVRATYGAEASIEWFDTPILLPSRLGGDPALAPAL